MATVKLFSRLKYKHGSDLRLIFNRLYANEIKLNEREQYDILPYEIIPNTQRLPKNVKISKNVNEAGGASM